MGATFKRGAETALALGFLICAGEAFAQQSAVQAASYGYGPTASPRAERPVLDLRRSAPPSAETLAAPAPDPTDFDEEDAPAVRLSPVNDTAETLDGFEETGVASWYGEGFRGRATANGETFDPDALTAAHPGLPMPSLIQVTNLDNQRSVVLRVNDRGPQARGRILDVSARAAEELDFRRAGEARVQVRYLGPAPRLVQAAHVPGEPVSLLPPPREIAMAPVPSPAPRATYQQAAADGGYMVQIGAFSLLENAHRARENALAAGAVSVEPRFVNGREIYRVRVGPWADRAAAEAARRHVAALGFGDAIVAPR